MLKQWDNSLPEINWQGPAAEALPALPGSERGALFPPWEPAEGTAAR